MSRGRNRGVDRNSGHYRSTRELNGCTSQRSARRLGRHFLTPQEREAVAREDSISAFVGANSYGISFSHNAQRPEGHDEQLIATVLPGSNGLFTLNETLTSAGGRLYYDRLGRRLLLRRGGSEDVDVHHLSNAEIVFGPVGFGFDQLDHRLAIEQCQIYSLGDELVLHQDAIQLRDPRVVHDPAWGRVWWDRSLDPEPEPLNEPPVPVVPHLEEPRRKVSLDD